MEILYEDAIALLRSWVGSKNPPSLTVDFIIGSLVEAHFICEDVDLSDETLTLWFGRRAWGNGNLNCPLRNTRFTLVKPDDRPSDMRSHEAENVECWLQLRFASGGLDDGCLITKKNSMPV